MRQRHATERDPAMALREDFAVKTVRATDNKNGSRDRSGRAPGQRRRKSFAVYQLAGGIKADDAVAPYQPRRQGRTFRCDSVRCTRPACLGNFVDQKATEAELRANL